MVDAVGGHRHGQACLCSNSPPLQLALSGLEIRKRKATSMPVITRKFPRTVGGDTFILLDLKSEQGDKVGANVQDKRDGIWLFKRSL